jgi:prepilin-type N-terminal cleavage/methylation domain-containing protein
MLRPIFLRRFGRRDVGFTLTELAIAMLVLGVLTSVAIPSFLGARNNSYDKEAQASIEVVLRAAKFHYQSQGDFSDGSSAQCGDSTGLVADLQKLEPNVDVVSSSVSSTSSRVVSVQAVQTWNSNAELLGCQGFYAVALSSSGSCWAVRLVVEGKFLAAGSVSPVVVNAQTNTSNSAVTTWTALAVNGHAFGVLKPQTSAADGDNTNGLTAIKTACKAATQSAGSATVSSNYIAPSQFYATWRDTTSGGTGSSSSSSSSSSVSYIVGDTGPGGGIVFYVATADFTSTGSDCGTACRYFEAAPSGWGNGITVQSGETTGSSTVDPKLQWCNNTMTLRNATSKTAIGDGRPNTATSTTGAAACTSGAMYHAELYAGGTKTDWHLPSKDELNQMCKWQRGVAWTSDATVCTGGTLNSGRNATGFVTGSYTSSSEGRADLQVEQFFGTGVQGTSDKLAKGSIRPVRAFG